MKILEIIIKSVDVCRLFSWGEQNLGLDDDNITAVSSQYDQNFITQIIVTKLNITWNIIKK
jgi:hypothetical protein